MTILRRHCNGSQLTVSGGRGNKTVVVFDEVVRVFKLIGANLDEYSLNIM
jgi:hypothetical protein